MGVTERIIKIVAPEPKRERATGCEDIYVYAPLPKHRDLLKEGLERQLSSEKHLLLIQRTQVQFLVLIEPLRTG